ncbi:lysophospholipid acyltransferase LPCAT4 isoform X2 [Ambystoma mexicanum]|uniref:lysophospholipid acyltransferase LPCAT4 isoform X2 n=1 Tax=Ambystoma mexicanum TaxID=8296 RepID=UPI0037E84F0A
MKGLGMTGSVQSFGDIYDIGGRQYFILGLLLFPIRFLLATISLFLMWPFAVMRVAGLSEKELREPITERRKVFHYMIRFLSRLMFFVSGFHWICIKGRKATCVEAPILVVAPHTSFFDPVILAPCNLPSVVSRVENLNIPVIGALLRFNQSILVSRHEPASRKKVVEEVKRRATSNGKWPQVLFFPEGTTSNGQVLLKFKPGAFIAGVPIQPVLVRYPNKIPATIWTWKGNGVFKVLWLSLSQLFIRLEIEFLPVYQPTPEEQKDPMLYASNIQMLMAKALGVRPTDYEIVGDVPVMPIGQLKVALDPGIWKLGKTLKKLGITPEVLPILLDMCSTESHRKVQPEELMVRLNLSVSSTTSKAFSYFQKDANGAVDFHEVILSVAAQDCSKRAEDLTQLAFKLFAEPWPEDKLRLYEDGFSAILRTLLGTSRSDCSKVFAEICSEEGTEGLSKDMFEDFALLHLDYSQLFHIYLRPPATRKSRQQAEEKQTWLPANGTFNEEPLDERPGGTTSHVKMD